MSLLESDVKTARTPRPILFAEADNRLPPR
jgi:hypothetical protein